MHKNISILITLCFLFFKTGLNAQEFRIQSPPGYNFIYESNNLPKNVDGSPYLGDWQQSELHLKNGNTISGIMMRYNVYTGQMIYKLDGKTYAIGTPDSIATIQFGNKNFQYKKFVVNDKVEQKYYEIIVDDKISLYNEYEIIINRSNYNSALDVGDKNDKFVLKEHLYMIKGDRLIEIDKKRKILDFFADKKGEITEFIKQEKISYKDKEDMAKLVEYYNEISSES